ncbi:kinesin-domain-containing protein, partial [Jaminaea rosea]
MASVTLDAGVGAGRFSGLGNHNFDAVHTGSSNDGLYKTLARPLVHSVLSGFNALIFAYGQTASGKTFTLSGDEKSGTEGITQKAIKDLFRGIRASKREREWLVRCSWLEVYNEGVKDLLEPTNVPQVRSSTTRGTFVSPLSEIIVTSPQAVYALLEQGQANRHVNATDWNEKSSRSHTAFKIVVESWARGADEAASSGDKKKVRISELVLVDLAGSEKYVTQGGKERRAEGANINKSLLTLGKVIYALSERTNEDEANATPGGGAGMHIPYRDSKLTRILQSSLSGNSKIAVVATLNQSVGALEESLSTINFAKRIKRVRLSAKLNEVDAPELMSQETQALIVKYRSE